MLPLWGVILGWILTAVIVVGNGLVVFLITTRRNLRTTTNWLVLSLAVADFGFGIFYYPRFALCWITQRCAKKYVVAIINSIGVFSVYASVTNLCALTLDRYLAIVKPLRYVTFMTKKRVALLIFEAWSVASLPVIPFLVMYLAASGKTYEIIEPIILWCSALLFLVVCVFLLFATVRILLVARRVARENAAVVAQLNFNHGIQHRAAFKARETASAKMVGIIVTFCIICYSLDIVDTILLKGFSHKQNETFYMLISLLKLLNSAVNPVAYAFFKKEIRRELKRLLCCKKY